MAGIPRITQVIFGSTGNVGTGGFGAAAGGNTATQLSTSTALSTIMGTSEYSAGWLSAVLGSSKFPAIEDINAFDYAMSTQIAYILERGIPEYDAGTSYNIGDITKGIGNSLIYKSITNANIGNSLGNATYWLACGDLANLGNTNLFIGGTTTGSANAQVLASLNPASGFSLANNGDTIICTAGFTNTGAMTFATTTPATGPTAVKINSSAGLVDPPAGAVFDGNTISLTVNTTAGVLVLDSGLPAGLFLQKANNLSDLASTSTARTNLGVAFTDSIGASGYYQFPGGLIIQWGSVSGSQSPSGSQSVTFPITFPNNLLLPPLISATNATGGDMGYQAITASSTSGITIQWVANRTWFAIGN